MNETIERYKQLRRELLEVDAELAASKLAYLARGEHTPLAARAALESCRADLRLHIHVLRPEVVALHEEAKRAKGQTFLARLVELCQAHGQGALVDQARNASRDYIDANGMAEALRVII